MIQLARLGSEKGEIEVVLSDIDRNLLQRCLDRQPRAWEDFVDRFLGLVIHVIHHSAQSRSQPLTPQDEEDLAAEVFLVLVKDDFQLLRRFRGESSLATYLTVVSRRVVVRELLRRKPAGSLASIVFDDANVESRRQDSAHDFQADLSNREQVQQLMQQLSPGEAEIVRLHHLEGKTYREISEATGVPENSIGPTLSRARAKMRAPVRDTG